MNNQTEARRGKKRQLPEYPETNEHAELVWYHMIRTLSEAMINNDVSAGELADMVGVRKQVVNTWFMRPPYRRWPSIPNWIKAIHCLENLEDAFVSGDHGRVVNYPEVFRLGTRFTKHEQELRAKQ